jgi:N-acyl-phosphatidylethanolamine-hydrolysing phospholipase D
MVCCCDFLYTRLTASPAYTDTVRRSHIRERNKALASSLSRIPGGEVNYTEPATEEEKAAIRKRSVLICNIRKKLTLEQFRESEICWSVLEPICRGEFSWLSAGRDQLTSDKWREQGAWEWAFWKIFISTVTLKLFYNG